MRKGPFLPGDFLPTKFSTADDKAAFGNALLHFVEMNCKLELFTNSLYDRLSSCYGHIAHYVEREIMRSSRSNALHPVDAWPPSLRIISCQSVRSTKDVRVIL